jgi:hypothetical protein
MANRLWHFHFGRGLVETPNDLGFNAGRPSHPELLDWLAVQFQRSGYRMKPMHRLIVTSETYRQSSLANPQAMAIDAGNRLLWRKSPQRLDAEEIRDAMLLSAEILNSTMGGQGYRDVEHFTFRGSNFYSSLNESKLTHPRRTIYRFTPRGGRNSFLDTFDCPDPSTTSPKRAATVTPLQALALMNNAMVFEASRVFAETAEDQASHSGMDPLEWIYERVYSRKPEDEERAFMTRFIDEHGLEALCRVLFNSNEFLYVR